MPECIVEVQNISKRYGNVTALDDVSLMINKGDYVVVVGPSGSGKTTLLLLLGGFEEPTSGLIKMQGDVVNHVPPSKRSTATVFQDYALFPHMKVLTNVEFGLTMRGVKRRERKARSRDMLRLVGLEGMEHRRPHQLSGGQRQRVALARALVVQPDVVLLDEPLGALDAALRKQMQRELKRIQEGIGITFVHVTHDQEEAMNIADTVVVIHDGRVQDHGTPERIYRMPMSLFSAKFMGDNNIFHGENSYVTETRAWIRTRVGEFSIAINNKPESSVPKIGSSVIFTVRPEDLTLGEQEVQGQNVIPNATVRRVSFAGSVTKLVTHIPEHGELIVQLQRARYLQLAPGQVVTLSFSPDDAYLLPSNDLLPRLGPIRG